VCRRSDEQRCVLLQRAHAGVEEVAEVEPLSRRCALAEQALLTTAAGGVEGATEGEHPD
jgi:hypothetical protein